MGRKRTPSVVLAVTILVVLVALASGACGGGATAGGAAAAPKSTTSTVPAATAAGEVGVEREPEVGGVAVPPPPALPAIGGATATTSPMRTTKAADPNDKTPMPLAVQAPSCAARGSTLPVTLKTEPDADIGMVIAFADNQAYETSHLGTTDATGRYSTVLPIKPDVPLGEAKLLVVAGSNGKGATAEHLITIVPLESQCR